ncbi:Potassium transporter 1, partial [Mucuna pruriens]
MNPSEHSMEQGISQQNFKRTSRATVLTLAYQSLGVVYGDLSTSPLYVYKTTFSGKLSLKEDDEEIFGVLSFIFWTFTIIALFKYIFIVMSADDNGEGGTFALYSLLCRNGRLSILPNQQSTDEKLSTYATEDCADTWQSSLLKLFFEKHPAIRKGLLVFVLLGTCMAIGDGVITPAISVSGVKVKISELHDNYVIMVSCVILVGLFSIQHHGTHRVAFLFAPVVATWLLCISGIGIYNIFNWNPKIYHALSPIYMVKFIKTTGIEGWLSLGGVVLSITACICKVPEGGWISLVLCFIFMCVMYTWNYGTMKKHQFDVENKISMNRMLSMGPSLGMVRVPGVGLMYSNLASGFPAMFGHFVTNLPAFHQVLVFVCVKSVQVPHVSETERLVIGRVSSKELGMFHCIIRYGYKDIQQEKYNFENKLISAIIQFVESEEESITHELPANDGNSNVEDLGVMVNGDDHPEKSFYKDESLQIMRAKEFGVTYILGHSLAKAKNSSSILKKFAIDIAFAFLSKNCRESDAVLDVSHTSLLEVGMTYYEENFGDIQMVRSFLVHFVRK